MKQALNHRCPRRRFACESLESRQMMDASMLRVTEFVASNTGSLLDADGESSDWIELHNTGDEAVSLAGLHLTDDPLELQKWTFPDGTSIAAGAYLIVFASGKDTVLAGGQVHTSFRLAAGGEFFALVDVDGTTIIDQFSPQFPPQYENISYGRAMAPEGQPTKIVADGATARAWVPTDSRYDDAWMHREFNDAAFNIVGPTGFGYENSPNNAVNYTNLIRTNVSSGVTSLYLRLAFQLETLSGVDRLSLAVRYDDGFVAYVNGQLVAQSNAPDSLQWNSRAAASHNDNDAVQFEPYDISSAIPFLREGDNVLAIHAMNLNPQSSDFLISAELSYQAAELIEPDQLGYFVTTTPGYANETTTIAGFAELPVFSLPHGIFDEPQSIELSTATDDAIIVYTTDGSTPQADENLQATVGTLYTSPILVDATTTLRARVFRTGFEPSFPAASTYLFLDDVLRQSPLGEVPAGWAADGVNGQHLDYGMDPDIIALYGEDAIIDSLTALPSISITTDVANLFSPSTGIYVNAVNRGRNWERPASIELINPDGSDGFAVNAGLRIRGGYSRNDFNPKHAFRLYFRGEYGNSKLEYPMFGDEGVDQFDVLDLRTAQNYSWSNSGDQQNTFLREVFGRDLQRDMGEPYTRSRYYHLYLDGVYWGVYQTQERVEEFYGESYFGGDEVDYDVVKADLGVTGQTEVTNGNDEAWFRLFTLAQQLADDPTGRADNYWTMQGRNPDGSRNPDLPVLLDVDNLINYMMVIFYTGGYDSGLSRFLGDNRGNNWFGIYNRATADSGFQFFIHDNEHSLGAEGNLHGTVGINRTGPFNNGNESVYEQFNPQYLHQDLLASIDYRQRFSDLAAEYFSEGGLLSPDANRARMTKRIEQVENAIIAEAARWGDAFRRVPRNKSDWETEVDWLMNSYFSTRSSLVVSQLRQDGLSPIIPAPVLSQDGGDVPPNYLLSISAATGAIYYTLDGATDPFGVGGNVNPSPVVQIYDGPISLPDDATIWIRALNSRGLWSALVKAQFHTVPLAGDYNLNGVVDAADYTVWKDSFGSVTDLAADGNGNGSVDAADFTVWRDNFGAGAVPVLTANAVAPVSDLVGTSQSTARFAKRTCSQRGRHANDQELAIDAVHANDLLPADPLPKMVSQALRFRTVVRGTDDRIVLNAAATP